MTSLCLLVSEGIATPYAIRVFSRVVDFPPHKLDAVTLKGVLRTHEGRNKLDLLLTGVKQKLHMVDFT